VASSGRNSATATFFRQSFEDGTPKLAQIHLRAEWPLVHGFVQTLQRLGFSLRPYVDLPSGGLAGVVESLRSGGEDLLGAVMQGPESIATSVSVRPGGPLRVALRVLLDAADDVSTDAESVDPVQCKEILSTLCAVMDSIFFEGRAPRPAGAVPPPQPPQPPLGSAAAAAPQSSASAAAHAAMAIAGARAPAASHVSEMRLPLPELVVGAPPGAGQAAATAASGGGARGATLRRVRRVVWKNRFLVLVLQRLCSLGQKCVELLQSAAVERRASDTRKMERDLGHIFGGAAAPAAGEVAAADEKEKERRRARGMTDCLSLIRQAIQWLVDALTPFAVVSAQELTTLHQQSREAGGRARVV
jgi:hypothetical protein